MNNRSLCYQVEEYKTPVITPNILLRGQATQFMEDNAKNMDVDEKDQMTKRLRSVTFVRSVGRTSESGGSTSTCMYCMYCTKGLQQSRPNKSRYQGASSIENWKTHRQDSGEGRSQLHAATR